MDIVNYTHDGTSGYLVETDENGMDALTSGLNGVDVGFSVQDLGGGMHFVSFANPAEKQIGKITMESIRDDVNDEVHLTADESRQL